MVACDLDRHGDSDVDGYHLMDFILQGDLSPENVQSQVSGAYDIFFWSFAPIFLVI